MPELSAGEPDPSIESAPTTPNEPLVEPPAEGLQPGLETPEVPQAPPEPGPESPAEGLFDGSSTTLGPGSSTLDAPGVVDPVDGAPRYTPAALPPAPRETAPSTAPETPTDATPEAPEVAPPNAEDLFDVSRARRVLQEPGSWASELPRRWRDASGKFQCDACIAAVSPDGVVLHLADGATVRVPYGALSVSDLKFVRRQIEARQTQLALDGASFAALEAR
jgi:hypothetical protein